MIKRRLLVLLLSPLFVLLILSGCAGIHAGQPPEEVLRERADSLIQAQRDNKWDVVYDFYDSAYKKSIAKQAFVNKRRGIVYGDYVIGNIEIDPAGLKAKVHIRSDFTMQGTLFRDSPSTQPWILENGTWHYKVKTMKELFTR